MIRPTRLVALAAILPALVVGQEPRTHTVVRGNTLWAIAGLYVGDPFQWPSIHEANRARIDNPHRIFPGWEVVIPSVQLAPAAAALAQDSPSGDPLGASAGSINPAAETAPGAGSSTPLAAAPTALTETASHVRWSASDAQVPPQTPAGQAPPRTVFYRERPLEVGGISAAAPMWDVPPEQFYAAPWLIPPATVPESSGVVEALEEAGDILSPRTTVRVYDRVRLAIDGALPAVGSRLQTMRVSYSTLEVGQVVLPTGILLVEELTPTGVVAVVETQFDRIALGDIVRLLPAYTPAPAGSTVPATGGTEATVLAYATDREVQTYGDYAFLDAGAAQGVRIGDEYVVVEEAPGSERASAGRFKVVSVLQDVATARIVELENPVFPPGVRLRPDRRVR